MQQLNFFSGISGSFKNSFQRFSVTIIIGLIASVNLIMFIKNGSFAYSEWHIRILIACGLAIPLSITSVFISEIFNFNLFKKLLLQTLLVAGCFTYGLFYSFRNIGSITFTIEIFILLHLLVSFVCFIQSNEENGFWQFNKILFIRTIITAIFANVIIGGLNGALLVFSLLFEVSIDDNYYLYINSITAGVFQIWFFVAGIPAMHEIRNLNSSYEYPKILSIFVQYILVPLLILYIIILYGYYIKIIINWNLPKGWVSWLIICLSFFGIITFLLVWPKRKDNSTPWVSLFSRYFYVVLIPLIILLFIAVGKRISDYGVTINRYYIVLLGLWLATVSLYNLVTKNEKIKFIPVSLSIFILLSLFGPWGFNSVSEKSQIKKLQLLLQKNNILKDNKIKRLSDKDSISIQDKENIISVLNYLNNFHNIQNIQHLTTFNLNAIPQKNILNFKQIDTIDAVDKIISAWGLNNAKTYYQNFDSTNTEEINENNKSFFYLYPTDTQINDLLPADNVKYIIRFRINPEKNDKISDIIRNESIYFCYNNQNQTFVLQNKKNDTLEFSIQEYLNKLISKHFTTNQSIELNSDDLIFTDNKKSNQIYIFFEEINGYRQNEKYHITRLAGLLIIK